MTVNGALNIRHGDNVVAQELPADGRSVIYLRDLAFGSRIVIDGPDPDMFEVSDDTLALAFDVPGHYRITVIPPDAAPAYVVRARVGPATGGIVAPFSWPAACSARAAGRK